MARIRKGLEGAVLAYNQSIGSIESRVLPVARKFHDMGAVTGEAIPAADQTDMIPRLPMATELLSVNTGSDTRVVSH
jgi:DNA recombination protein RmuC